MKVLLLNPPFETQVLRDNYCCHTTKADYIWPPSDLIYLSGILHSSHIEVNYLDGVANNLNWEYIKNHLKNNSYDCIIALTGTLTINSDLKYLLNYKEEKLFTNIYLLGNICAFEPEKVFKNFSGIDGIFHSFFDISIADFITGKKGEFSGISYYDDNGNLKLGKINANNKPKHLPTPRHEFFLSKNYSTPMSKKSPLMTCMTSYGCVYSCKFCIASEISYYYRNLNDLEIEFNSMIKNGVKEIYFMDSIFNTNPKFTEQLCQLMIKNNYNFSWCCNIHSRLTDKKTLKLMKEAGCHTVQIGVESANAESLSSFAPTKKNTLELEKTFQECHQLGIKTLGYFIIGFPNESRDDVLNTINLAKKLSPTFASFSTLVPDYGTQWNREAVELGIIDTSENVTNYDNSGKAFLKGTHLTEAERNDLVRLAYIKFYLRPRQIIKYLMNPLSLKKYILNGINLIWTQILFRR